MKICIVVSQLTSGGMERVVSVCANYWAKKHHVLIITFTSKKYFYKISEKIDTINIEDSTNKSSLSTTKNIFRIIKGIAKHSNRFNADVVLSFGTATNVMAVLSKTISRIPTIISERSSPKFNHGIIWMISRKLVYRFSDLAIYQTTKSAALYNDILKSPIYKIIGNPISDEFNLKISKDKRENIILSVGRLDLIKGHHLLIEAIRDIHLNDWKVIIVGDGEEKLKLIKKIKLYNLSDKVSIEEPTKNILEYYMKSKIFVLPSLIEGYPNALMEAMVCGCACISYNCETGPADIIRHGNNGLLVEANNIDALSKEIQSLINNEVKIQNFSTEAIKLIDTVNSKAVMAKWDQAINTAVGVV